MRHPIQLTDFQSATLVENGFQDIMILLQRRNASSNGRVKATTGQFRMSTLTVARSIALSIVNRQTSQMG